MHHVDIVCQTTVIRNWTGCAYFSNDAREHLNQLTRAGCLLTFRRLMSSIVDVPHR